MGDVLWAGPGRYSAPAPPDSSDPEYTTAYSPELQSGGNSDGTKLPSAIRIGTREPVENRSTDHEFNARQTSEFHKRHSVETYVPGNWRNKQRRVPTPRNPYWTHDPTPRRPTATQTPTGGVFTRPWHVPRNLADIVPGAVLHFSLADHRRNFDVMTMTPRGRVGMNTYRAQPRPWDENLYRPPQASNSPAGASLFGNRAHRLGG
jgi:hypothetical protein